MQKQKKTDNGNLGAKLYLRKYFLQKYHSSSLIDVMDCCQGNSVLWTQLKKLVPVASYWGVDLKKKKGRISIDSCRILSQAGWPQNVIDIDTYGSPWKHWFAMLPNITKPTTVFLTVGQVVAGMGTALTGAALEAMGLRMKQKFAASIHLKLAPISVRYCLAAAYDYGIIPIEIGEVISDGNARYLGVRLTPKNGD